MARTPPYARGSLALTKQPGAKQPRAKCPPTKGEPSGYIDHANWMEERYKRGLIQLNCSKCKLWHIWVKGTAANVKKRNQQRKELGQE